MTGKEKEYWKNLKKFKDIYDIPKLPIVDNDDWLFIVDCLVKSGAIPKKDLIDGATYRGRTRNSSIAMWDKKNEDFIHYRDSWGQKYRDVINHFEDDNGYALFVPIKLIRK